MKYLDFKEFRSDNEFLFFLEKKFIPEEVLLVPSSPQAPIRLWCKENCKGKFYISWPYTFFERTDDALIFKLTTM